jgi:hypothetical protein
MPRADAAKLIADHLHAIPGGDGKPVRLLSYSTTGKSPEQQAETSRRAQDIGNRLIELLEAHGYSVTHHSDPKPEIRDGEYIVHDVHCMHCGDKVLELAHMERDPSRPGRFRSTLHKMALEGMGHTHSCRTVVR